MYALKLANNLDAIEAGGKSEPVSSRGDARDVGMVGSGWAVYPKTITSHQVTSSTRHGSRDTRVRRAERHRAIPYRRKEDGTHPTTQKRQNRRSTGRLGRSVAQELLIMPQDTRKDVCAIACNVIHKLQPTTVFFASDDSGLEIAIRTTFRATCETDPLLSFAFAGAPFPLALLISTSHNLCASAKLTNSSSGHSLTYLDMQRLMSLG